MIQRTSYGLRRVFSNPTPCATDAGSWILDTGCGILDSGYGILDTGSIVILSYQIRLIG